MKTIIERGASWTLDETKLLLALWGQDLVERTNTGGTNVKRTKEVYEKISERFSSSGYDRTPDQIRTRIFNMIAEYRRIMKDKTPERIKKCIFFEPLNKIYQAKHMDDIKSALDDYEPPYSPFSSEKCDESILDSESRDGNETITGPSTSASMAAASDSVGAGAPDSALSSSPLHNDAGNKSSNFNQDNSCTNTTSASFDAINDNKLGDASSEKDSSIANSNSSSGNSAKRVKLEKSGNQNNNAATTDSNSSNANSSTTGSSNEQQQSNSKQSKSSSSTSLSNATAAASTSSIPFVTTQLPSASTSSSSNAAAATTSTAAPRHQSLLLPNVNSASSAASTPINKLTTASSSNGTPSYININSAKLPIIRTNQLIGHANGNESINLNGTGTRLPTTAAIASHQLYQAPVNTFDVTSSALLIDRMFAHLSRESENMREWIALEKERLAIERQRRQQEAEREVRRERILTDTLTRFQEQWLSFLARLDPRISGNPNTENRPELKIPMKDGGVHVTTPSQSQNSTDSVTVITEPSKDGSTVVPQNQDSSKQTM